MTRRELLERLSFICMVAGLGCRAEDWFDRELVCIHIFGPQDSIPAPLLEKVPRRPRRRRERRGLGIGLPELVTCTTRRPLLELFQYFWPFSREDYRQLERSITIESEIALLGDANEVEEWKRVLRARRGVFRKEGENLAVLFTLNEFSHGWAPELIAACQAAAVDEFVVFKDPSRPPYLCEFASRQKGFKRPPP
jgi:hypothetical protein